MKLPSQPTTYSQNFEQQRSGIIERAVTTLETSGPFPPTQTEISLGVSVNTKYPVGDVRRYGAVGDGTTDDTDAFMSAVEFSNLVWAHDTGSSYLVSGLNLPVGKKIRGGGKIKTSGGTVIDLALVNLEYEDAPLRVMFAESNALGWEEMLDIRSQGYNTIMAYLWYADLDDVIYNAEAVGLKVIVHSKIISANLASATTLATAATAYDSRPSVIGYHVLDEPVGNSISVSDQNTVLALFRGLTNKPLFTAEYSVVYSTSGYLATDYDAIFINNYYADEFSTANDVIASYIRNVAWMSATCPKAKLIPLVGLFNDTGFAKSTTVTRQLAETLVRFSQDGSFGVFCWNAGTAGTYGGVRNVAAYRAAARNLANLRSALKPYTVDIVPIGTLFTYSNALDRRWVNCVDGATPDVLGESNLVPWYVEDVNSAVDMRQQDFTDNGLMLQGTSGRIGIAGAPAGMCCGLIKWDDRDTTNSGCTIVMGASANNGYTMTETITQTIANGATEAFYGELDADHGKLPMFRVDVAGAVDFPYCFVKGYLTFTDVAEVAF